MNILKAVVAAVALTASISAAAGDAKFSAVYTETNAAEGNAILVFRREHDGDLDLVSTVSTRGRGTGAGLGNQGALVLRSDARRLYAVNAGSNDISAFVVTPRGLVFIERVASGGARPISLTLHEDILYVLNAGDPNQGIAANITGFRVNDDRRLEALPNSTRALSTAAPGPAQVQFHPWGDILVVTEKDTNRIDLFDVQEGVAGPAVVHPSSGQTPFGFAFDKRGRLIVSEAFGGAPNASAMSSYDLTDAASLEVISASVPTTETAACWVVVSKNGKFAYTTNTGSGTISGYRISRSGELTLLEDDGVTASTGAGSTPIDMALSSDGRFAFSLNPGVGTIASFRVRTDGSLVNVATVPGIPASASGLAAR